MGINAVLRHDRGQYPENGHKAAVPAGWSQELTSGEFRVYFIL